MSNQQIPVVGDSVLEFLEQFVTFNFMAMRKIGVFPAVITISCPNHPQAIAAVMVSADADVEMLTPPPDDGMVTFPVTFTATAEDGSRILQTTLAEPQPNVAGVA